MLDTGLDEELLRHRIQVRSVPVGDVQRSESCQPFGSGHDSGNADVRPHHQRRDRAPDATRTEVCLLGSIVGRVRISGPASLMRFLALCIFLGVSAGNAQNPPSSTPSKADRLRSLIAQAEAAEQQNRLDEAVALYEQILRIRPGWASAELNLGLVYHSRAEYAKAIQSLTNALAHNAGLHSALLFRGASYYHTGRYNDAVRDLKNYLRTEASSTEALSYLGNAQLAKNDPAEAALAYASLARVSNEPSAYFQLTDAYIQLARSVMERLTGEDAEAYQRRIIATDASTEVEPCELPSDPELTRVRCAADRFEFETATATLIEILRRPGITQESIFNSVGCVSPARASRGRQSSCARARVDLGSVAPSAGSGAIGRHRQGGEGVRTRDRSAGRRPRELRKIRPVRVQARPLRSRSGTLRAGLDYRTRQSASHGIDRRGPRAAGSARTSRALLETALRANPHETQTRLYLAQSLIRLKRSAEAVRILEAAPDDPDGRIHYLLGRTYQQQGESEKARKAMDEFRRLRKDSTK